VGEIEGDEVEEVGGRKARGKKDGGMKRRRREGGGGRVKKTRWRGVGEMVRC